MGGGGQGGPNLLHQDEKPSTGLTLPRHHTVNGDSNDAKHLK